MSSATNTNAKMAQIAATFMRLRPLMPGLTERVMLLTLALQVAMVVRDCDDNFDTDEFCRLLGIE